VDNGKAFASAPSENPRYPGTAPTPEAELRALLASAHADMLRRDEEILASIHSMQTQLNAASEHTAQTGESGGLQPSRYLEYRQLIGRVRQAVSSTLPASGTVIVMSRGDDELLDLDGRRAVHFPQGEEGQYAGYHPASSADAIAQLETLRNDDGKFLLIPHTELWWLESYPEFNQHLEENYALVAREPQTALIFDLRDRTPGRKRRVRRRR
jgi:hypothetical protein